MRNDIEHLKNAIGGTVTTREDAAYDEVLKALIWNGRKPERQAGAIVRAASVADVQATVRYAAAHGLRVSVRGSGHHFSGVAVQDDIVLDLSALNDVRVDAAARTADVGPTVLNGEAARIFGEYGLAFPLGHCQSVSLSGYLLGGGFGWNSGAWGMACFNVLGVQVVMADGEIREASATENAEIFWAARGAGPEFFGIVTRYRLKLHPLPKAITTNVWTYPVSAAAEVERWMKASMEIVPRNVEFTALVSSAPPPLADKVDKVFSGIATVFAETEEEAHAVLARIASMAPPGALDLQAHIPTPFQVLYDIIQQFFPVGHRYSVNTYWAAPHARNFLEELATETLKAPAPRSFALGVVLPPAAVHETLPDAAFSMIGHTFVATYAIWEDPAEDAANIGWVRETARRLGPSSIGSYLGEADIDHPLRLAKCFSIHAWHRLRGMQAKYDPTGMFRSKQSLAADLGAAA